MEKITVTKDQFQHPCRGCKALCCQYIVLDTPISMEGTLSLHALHWQLTRPNIRVVTWFEKGTPVLNPENWEVRLMERCSYLSEDNLCLIYDSRPAFCANYPPFPAIGDTTASPCLRYEPNVRTNKGDHVFRTAHAFAAQTKRWFGFDPHAEYVDLRYNMNKISAE